MSRLIVDKFTHQSAMQLHRTLYLMDKQAERVLQDRHSLTLSQFFVLAQLVRSQLCQRELAEAIGITPAAISRHVGLLVRLGLLDRQAHDSDKRFELIVITEQGRREFEAAAADLDDFFEARYKSLKPAQKQQIMDSIGSLMGCYDGNCQ